MLYTDKISDNRIRCEKSIVGSKFKNRPENSNSSIASENIDDSIKKGS